MIAGDGYGIAGMNVKACGTGPSLPGRGSCAWYIQPPVLVVFRNPPLFVTPFDCASQLISKGSLHASM